MNLDVILDHLKKLEKIPRKRIIKEIQQIDINILNKYENRPNHAPLLHGFV